MARYCGNLPSQLIAVDVWLSRCCENLVPCGSPWDGLSRKGLTKGLTKGNGFNATTVTTTITKMLFPRCMSGRHTGCTHLGLLWNTHGDIFLPKTITFFNFLNPILEILRLLQKRCTFLLRTVQQQSPLFGKQYLKYAHWTSQWEVWPHLGARNCTTSNFPCQSFHMTKHIWMQIS